jgi:SPP1 gp7 family putative phage head morphogenesis protein
MTVNNISERVNKELGQITASLSTTRSSRLDLRLALDRMGISARNPSLIETLVRTHAQMAFSAAQQQLDADNDLIWGYRYVTVGDNRVRPDHQRLDGTVAAKDDPIWSTITPPNGWNCRCALIELLDPEPRMVPDGAAQEVDAAFQFNPGELLQ